MNEIFKININEINENPYYFSKKNEYDEDKKKLTNNIIEECYNPRYGSFDGKKMQDRFFPQISQTSVFLSHSYKDIEKALSIKSKIESECKNIKVFIDSLYWQSVYDAEIKLAEQYNTNTVLKHLHIMITTAIAQMIQSSRYFIFFESENSIADIKHNKTTESPWIYFELEIANMLNPKEITLGLENLLESSQENKKIPMRCFFNIDDIIKNMNEIKLNELLYNLRWK
ncbi:TIR domain-containing protein [Campylobacter hyointestinalis]|uniref:TIR domain protein n=1 Tax=Campylobacter hyointestinalis subsp. lawsonii TaxID=91353 RepID=A0AAV6EIK0_CAMHY|nr:toll/interleukin-1 receptor domain-containing protein [Campylobacter hyointestinalis]KAB0613784.1 hypothetical protein F7P66_03710 [Campylobacter hyointestinalis subsp. lawsonii]QKF70257.1 hypothetical protein CHLWT_1742 [Campylobacter hyointestinalis subsp. lawsonii]RAZ28115.1 hypothetical protein CHLT_05500 [Campylobacter hyointestinalis subsp. lawsonii]